MSDIAFNLRCWRNAYNPEFWDRVTTPMFEAWMKKEGFTPSEAAEHRLVGLAIKWAHPERNPVYLSVNRTMTGRRRMQDVMYALNEYDHFSHGQSYTRLGDALYELLVSLHPQERP